MRTPRPFMSGFTLVELMFVVAIIGVLTTIAVPAFLSYTKRARTIEATMNVRKMTDGAMAYFYAEHATSSGQIITSRLPYTDWRGWAPSPAHRCSNNRQGQRLDPIAWSSSAYGDPILKLVYEGIMFEINSPFYYSTGVYTNVPDGVVPNSPGTTFTGSVYGDIDCNGFFAQFSRQVIVTAERSLSGGPLYDVNPLE